MRYFFAILIFVSSSFAWDGPRPDSSRYFWAFAGIGTTHQEWSEYGLGIGANVISQHGKHLWMLRWDQNYEIQHDTYGPEKIELVRQPEQNIHSIGVLYGRGKRSHQFIFGAAAGLAYVHGDKRGNFLYRETAANFRDPVVYEYYEKKSFDTIGLPIMLRGSVQALQNIGFELEFYTVLNPVRSYVGWLFGLQIGHLR